MMEGMQLMPGPQQVPRKIEWKVLKEGIEIEIHNLHIREKMLLAQLDVANKHLE